MAEEHKMKSSLFGYSKKAVDNAIEAINTENSRKISELNTKLDMNNKTNAMLQMENKMLRESKKQLEIAIQLEPDNEKYKTAYKKLNDKLSYDAQNGGANQGVYRGQTVNSDADEQMGGNFCAQCIQC
ncbi:MAG: hypothetical protein K2L36_05550, partial [Eubacterium sp.]|nr:hypothetical protein [Eubacterium sp.]